MKENHLSRQSFFRRVYEGIRILFTDIFPALFTCIIPNAISWVYRTIWTRSICSFPVQCLNGKAPQLFVHGDIRHKTGAALFLHGDHSHPLTMLHLGDIAQSEGRAVFSVYLRYNDENPEGHRLMLSQSIQMINQMVLDNGETLTDLVLVGYSRGALEAANEAYVENNSKITGVISIAGRFKVIKPSLLPCRKSLEESVYAVWDQLHNSSSARVPLFQIAALKDWCMDPEASVIRKDNEHLYIDAGHLGIINHPRTLEQVRTWMHLDGLEQRSN